MSHRSSRCAASEVTTDVITVWVHGTVQGTMGCIGRFGRMGVDIHNPPGSDTECLFCTHEPTTRNDWDLFVAKMQEHYGIKVPDKHMPRRLAEGAQR